MFYPRRTGLFRNLITCIVLLLAITSVAVSVFGRVLPDIARLPELVHDAFRSVANAI